MKTYAAIVSMVIMTILLLVPNADAGIIKIKMNFGKEYSVERYWEKGGKVYFTWLGGQIGFNKEQIESIKEVIATGDIELVDLIIKRRAEQKQKSALELAKEVAGEKNGEQIDIDVAAQKLGFKDSLDGLGLKAKSEYEAIVKPDYDSESSIGKGLKQDAKGDIDIRIEGILITEKPLDKLQPIYFTYKNQEDKVIAEKTKKPEAVSVKGQEGKKRIYSIVDTIPANLKPTKAEISVIRYER